MCHNFILSLERAAGIEPATCPWQGYVLPLAPCPLIVKNIFEVSPLKQITAHLLHCYRVLLPALRIS